MKRFEIRMFGGLKVIRDSVPIDVASSKQRALLAILAISPNLTVSTDRIIEDLWHDEPPSQPMSTLRYHLSKLRSRLHEPGEDRDTFIVTEAGGYAMVIDPQSIDTTHHERLVDDAAVLLETNPDAAVELIREAASIASGPPIPEFAYEEFASRFVRHVEATVLRCRLLDVDLELSRGEYEFALPALERLTAENPYDEGIYRRLMTSLYRSGRASDALRVFQIARTRLGEDLGLEPSPELADLEDQILLHRLPPAKAARAHRSLPPETSSLVGRDDELASLDQISGTGRLVTVTGLPGVGKTRIALRHAHSVGSSIWLAIPRDGSVEEIEGLLRSALLRAVPHLSFDGDDVFGSLSVLDSTVIVDGAQRSTASPMVVQELLRSAPDVRIVATSTSPLGVEGEQVLTLAPLGTRASIDLFRQRSADLHFDDASIEPVASGIPSVIEAAAMQYRRTGSAIDVPAEWPTDADMGGAKWPAEWERALLGLVLLREPFDAAGIFAAASGDEETVRHTDSLIDSGILATTDGGWAIHSLVRRSLLRAMSSETVEAALRRAAEMDGSLLSTRVVEQMVLEGRRHGLDEAVDRALAALVPIWWHAGPRTGRSVVIGHEAGGALDTHDPDRGRLLYVGAHLALIDNDIAQAVELIHRHAEGIEDLGALARSRHHQLVANLAMYEGDLPTALEKNREAARVSIAADLPNSTHLLASTGFVDTMLNDGAAAAHTERVLAAGAAHGQDIGIALAAEMGGLDAALAGDGHTARLLLSTAIGAYRDMDRSAWSTAAVTLLAHLECDRDDPDRALSIITELESASSGVSPGAIGGAKGRALAMQGEVEDAVAALRDGARSIADDTNPVWTFRLLAGAAYGADGDPGMGFNPGATAHAALGTADRAGLRVSPPDRRELERIAGDDAPSEPMLEVLRRL